MPHYQIEVLEIGYDTAFPLGVAFDFWHMSGETGYSPFSMTLLRGEGHNILVDCGIDPKEAFCAKRIELEHDQNCHNPTWVLRSAGLEPAVIDTVILTHCHWDHISGLCHFPNATFYIQRKEYSSWLRVLADPDFPLTHKGVINPEALKTLQQYESEGRLVFFDGDVDNFLPGLSIKAAGGHSFCQSMLFVDGDDGHFAIVGDVAMRPESFTGTDAFSCFLPNLKFATGTIEEIAHAYRQVLDWVGGDVSHIIMSHDGTRRNVYPTVKSSLGLDITTISK